MDEKTTLSFNTPADSPMSGFLAGVRETLVQQDDFRGIGGHGLEDHGGHGPHSQISIGMGGGLTVNFRTLDE